jgi:diguanylate cyclase (GGDEF)-like protein/PAS domain S-box-containing protein
MSASAGSSQPESGAVILVVDDNAAKRLAIVSVLEQLGHTTIEAESGEAALREVMKRSFAVILLDVQMPGMDGYETAQLMRMRRESEHTPIIFTTAHAESEADIPEAYASGAVDFIFAPIVPAVLRAKVTVFVDLFLKARDLERSLSHATTLRDESRDREERARSVLDNVANGIVTIDEEGVIESFNRAASDLFGYEETEAVGQPFSMIVSPRQRDDPAASVDATPPMVMLRDTDGRSVEAVGRRKDGTTFPIELELSDVQLESRKVHIGCLRDIFERQTYTESLRYQALHDDLTDLPNRVLFGDRVHTAIRSALRLKEPLALLVMDLDGFKQVNDTLGHQQGNCLLKLVAERLVGCLREGDTVARLGGDEFGILPIGGTDLAGAATVAWKIMQALEEPFAVDGHTIEVKASIGMTLFPDHGDNMDDLLRRADLAMYDAKRTGSGYAMFAAAQEDIPARRLALLGDLRHCVARNELVLHYQPKIDLATHETTGVEALLRWNHPSGRVFMPDEFMSELESSRLMIPITEWVINEALGVLRGWRDDGFDLTLAVNLGARCLAEEAQLFDTVERLTNAWGIPPEKLTFELTESALIDTAQPGLLGRLEGLTERLSIADFGTGYSSLAYLQQLPVDEIKVDRSFVTTMLTAADKAVMVRSIIDLAHNLGVKVVAEGVEDAPTMDRLIEYGCDAAQGDLFSAPVPAEALLEWLETSAFGVPRRLRADLAA